MPSNPGKISTPINLIETFRLVSSEMIVMFWEFLGQTLELWNRFDPHDFEKIAAF